MQKILLVFLFFILILPEAKSQIYFKGYDLYARDNHDSPGRLIKTSDGNLVLACIQKNCYDQQILGIAITKFTVDGGIIWSKQIQSVPIPLSADIVQTSDEGYAVAFTAYDTSAMDSNTF